MPLQDHNSQQRNDEASGAPVEATSATSQGVPTSSQASSMSASLDRTSVRDNQADETQPPDEEENQYDNIVLQFYH